MTPTTALTYILIATWPVNGQWVEKREAATTREACEAAADAGLAGRGLPLYADGPAREARCIPGDAFTNPHWYCIEGNGVPEAAKCR